MTPQAAAFTGICTNQIQPLPSPTPSTNPKPPKTMTTPHGHSPVKHRASLLMVAPKISRPTIRSGTGFDFIHHILLLSVCQFHSNPTPSSPSASPPRVTRESPVHAQHETTQEVEYSPCHIQSETVQYQKEAQKPQHN
ncbi:hypothetical protein JB92DRAFT_3124050 [Gautieria morchelliformis]|nr:hypothetical protein JB92DRAFT_3124050 [Gautieria morchelliformis]